MSSPSVFVGIDVSKDFLDIAVLPSGASWRSPNSPDAFPSLLEKLLAFLPSLIVLEASGGYELDPAMALAHAGLPVSVVNPRQVRAYAKAIGQLAKTDRLDALVLARFAEAVRPPSRPLPEPAREALEAVVTRRRQLTEMVTSEQNRKARCRDTAVRRELDEHLRWLRKRLRESDNKLKKLIRDNLEWKEKAALLRSVPGVGPVVSATLLAELPELGQIGAKPLAALVGVAPFAHESGRTRGVRQIEGGRAEVRAKLYMAALVGIRRNSVIKEFYERLVEAGKRKKVALTACMHKLLTILNAMVRHNEPWAVAGATP